MRPYLPDGVASVGLAVLLAGFLITRLYASSILQPSTNDQNDAIEPLLEETDSLSSRVARMPILKLPAPPPIQFAEHPQINTKPLQHSVETEQVRTFAPLQSRTDVANKHIKVRQITPLQPRVPKEFTSTGETLNQKHQDQQVPTSEELFLEEQTLAAKTSNAAKHSTLVDAIYSDEKYITSGRTLLRILEHGSGPVVEIAWPRDTVKRQQLYAAFRRCFGMQVGLIDHDGNVYVAAGIKGIPWDLSLDRFSGFVRQSIGALTLQERQSEQVIRSYHKYVGPADLIRIMPREVDAYLLGSLRQIIGSLYEQANNVRATYHLRRNIPMLADIVADDTSFTGEIDFSPVISNICR